MILQRPVLSFKCNDFLKMANLKAISSSATLSFRLCNWLSLLRLVSWINHLPPACWSTFWKSNFKQQLGCRFDMMDNESYFFFVFWHMQLYMSWYIRSFFGFTFLNILYFFKYSCTNIFHRRSLYTFYYNYVSGVLCWIESGGLLSKFAVSHFCQTIQTLNIFSVFVCLNKILKKSHAVLFMWIDSNDSPTLKWHRYYKSFLVEVTYLT